MPHVKESPLIKKFLKIEEHYDEYGIKKNGNVYPNEDISINPNNMTTTKSAMGFNNQEIDVEEPINYQKNLPPTTNNKNFYNGNILTNQQQQTNINQDDNISNNKDPAESFHSHSSYSNYSKNKVNEINAKVNGFQTKDFNRAINYEQQKYLQEQQSQANLKTNGMN